MRADEKTYKAWMSTDDPDKQDSLHEKAVSYLTEPDKIAKLANLASLPEYVFQYFKISSPLINYSTNYNQQTQRYIKGYADLALYFRKETNSCRAIVIVEVKSKPVSSGAIVQQLSTYANIVAQTHEEIFLIAATLFRLPVKDKELLLTQNIKYIYLDPAVINEWASKLGLDSTEAF